MKTNYTTQRDTNIEGLNIIKGTKPVGSKILEQWSCHECGSTNISKRYTLWANPNEENIRDGNIESSDDMDWCYDCNEETVVIYEEKR